MPYVYIDSGTTNTRTYLIENGKVICTAKAPIGSRDTVATGSNEKYILGLRELYSQVLIKNKLNEDDIEDIYASGMITSPFGMAEVQHVVLPVSLERLAGSMVKVRDERFSDRYVYLVPGVKNFEKAVDRENVFCVDTMRGEEIECFGACRLLDGYDKKGNTVIILPGSHTNAGYMRDGVLTDCSTTLAGEVFNAIATNSLLSGSIDVNLLDYDESLILKAYGLVKKQGLSKALHYVNMMQIFRAASVKEMTSFLEGIVYGCDVFYLKSLMEEEWKAVNRIVIAGAGIAADIIELLLKNSFDKCPKIIKFKESCSVEGIKSMVDYRKRVGM